MTRRGLPWQTGGTARTPQPANSAPKTAAARERASRGHVDVETSKCYIITKLPIGGSQGAFVAAMEIVEAQRVMAHSHHHHHPGEGHPPVAVAPSILRLSAAQRLAGAGVLIALLWAAVFWAMR
jgi:hypothetical protein